jgi:ABC-type uncharacterized transport system involved in gliding motility auxiliary subunit
MNTNRKLRLQLMMQNSFFVLLFLALVFLIGFISRDYHVSRDFTQANRNTLTEGSINILKQMKGPIHIKIFASKDDKSKGQEYRKAYADFVARYQRSKQDISMEFIDPAENPKLVQDEGIKADGEFVVEFNKRTEHILPPFVEQDMTNLLVRLSRSNAKPIMYLDAHGERNLMGIKNHDLGEFGKQLEKKGFKLANPDLMVAQSVPANGAMLIIASPAVNVTEVEAKKIKTYLEAGGNLLWLLDDNNYHGLESVAEYLGVEVKPGMVIDQSSVQYGADPTAAFMSQYGEHAITKTFALRTVFPEARMVDAKASYENGWKVARLVDVAQNGWLETGNVQGSYSFNDKEDIAGPINIAVALERTYGKRGQRVVVVGNANFLSNTFVANEGNLDLGVNMVNWLAGDDDLITIQPKPLKDSNVVIPSDPFNVAFAWLVYFGFQMILPAILLIVGIVTWWKRRKA